MCGVGTAGKLLVRSFWGQWHRLTRLLGSSWLLHPCLGTHKTMWNSEGHLWDSSHSFHERWEELDQGPEFKLNRSLDY